MADDVRVPERPSPTKYRLIDRTPTRRDDESVDLLGGTEVYLAADVHRIVEEDNNSLDAALTQLKLTIAERDELRAALDAMTRERDEAQSRYLTAERFRREDAASHCDEQIQHAEQVKALRADLSALREAHDTLKAFAERYDGYMSRAFTGPTSYALHPEAAATWKACRAALSRQPSEDQT